MTKTYTQVMKQIQTLSREAEALKRKEVEGVIARIKEAIRTYELTADDLGLGGGTARKTMAPAKPGRKSAGKRSAASAVRYRDADGNVWGGRGPRPKWLRDALGSGKQLGDFAV